MKDTISITIGDIEISNEMLETFVEEGDNNLIKIVCPKIGVNFFRIIDKKSVSETRSNISLETSLGRGSYKITDNDIGIIRNRLLFVIELFDNMQEHKALALL